MMFLFKVLFSVKVNFEINIIYNVGNIVFRPLMIRIYLTVLRNVKLGNQNFYNLFSVTLEIQQKFSLLLVSYELIKPVTTV